MKNGWIKIARSNEVSLLKPYVTNKRKALPAMCLWREPDNTIAAIERFCPLGKEDLAEGKITNDGVVCPKHKITWSSLGNANKRTALTNTISYWWPTKEINGEVFVIWR